MALETIDFHSDIVVANPAEVLLAFDTNRFGIRTIDRMAINAFFQRKLNFAIAIVNRFVTIVAKHIHVVYAHKLGICDAGIAFSFRNHRTDAGLLGTRRNRERKKHRKYERKPLHRYSPSPILI